MLSNTRILKVQACGRSTEIANRTYCSRNERSTPDSCGGEQQYRQATSITANGQMRVW
ncbi:unnamed protein product [Ceratitis capitata]|uniref:(Mediterranean fruit fly) hypothetical protein n=1 Tax=Ceratitis capitata TaxID=7213 RepID=A0A811U5L1_CERCA|nr:unnamed protein product [Ceratitis capitata]